MKINNGQMRNRILNLCKMNSKYANDDLALMAAVWIGEGWDQSRSLYDNLMSVSRPETIRRTRQKLQQEGLIKPSEKTLDNRYKDWKQARLNLW